MPCEISVVVLTYNRRFFLEKCLESLFTQSVPWDKFEIIVVDDGSDDGTAEFVKGLSAGHPNLKYIYQSHGGVSKARNTGIKNSTAGLISFIADDYIIPGEYVKTIFNFFKENIDAKAISFKMSVPDKDRFISKALNAYTNASFKGLLYSAGKTQDKTKIQALRYSLSRIKLVEKPGIYFNLSASRAACFRREVFDKIGLFDEKLPSGEDTDMGIRMADNGIGIYHYPDLKIIHEANEGLWDILKKWFRYGMNVYNFKLRYPGHPMRLADSFKNALYFLINIILNPIWRAIQADSLIDAILFFPVIFLINLSYTLGIFYSQFKALFGNKNKESQ